MKMSELLPSKWPDNLSIQIDVLNVPDRQRNPCGESRLLVLWMQGEERRSQRFEVWCAAKEVNAQRARLVEELAREMKLKETK